MGEVTHTAIAKQMIIQQALTILADNVNDLENKLSDERSKIPILPEIMKEQEAADYLKCSKPHLQNERNRGKITYLKCGRLIRYRIDDLDKYLEKIRVPAWNNRSAIEEKKQPAHWR